MSLLAQSAQDRFWSSGGLSYLKSEHGAPLTRTTVGRSGDPRRSPLMVMRTPPAVGQPKVAA